MAGQVGVYPQQLAVTDAQKLALKINSLERQMAALQTNSGYIAADAITATEINVTQLSAISADMGSINAGTITGAIMRTSSGNPKVQFDSTGLFATDSTGANVFALSASAGTADMKGHLHAQGIDIDAGDHSSTPDSSRVRWLRASDGALVGHIYGVDDTTSQNDTLALGVNAIDPNNTSAVSLENVPNLAAGGNQWAKLGVQRASDLGTDASTQVYVFTTNKAGTSSLTKKIIDATGSSDWLQLLTGANRKLALGSVTITWPGGSSFATVPAVNPGLPSAPVFYTGFVQGLAGLSLVVERPNTGAVTATSLPFAVQTRDGTSPANTTPGTTLYWLAIS